MGKESGLGGTILFIVQIGLLALYYSESMWLGINWSALPWWIVLAPALASLITIVILLVILAIAVIVTR